MHSYRVAALLTKNIYLFILPLLQSLSRKYPPGKGTYSHIVKSSCATKDVYLLVNITFSPELFRDVSLKWDVQTYDVIVRVAALLEMYTIY